MTAVVAPPITATRRTHNSLQPVALMARSIIYIAAFNYSPICAHAIVTDGTGSATDRRGRIFKENHASATTRNCENYQVKTGATHN